MRLLLALSFVLLTAGASNARAAGPPLQAVLATAVPGGPGESVALKGRLDGGNAVVAMHVANREDPRTAVVHLRFTYRVAPGTIALDEIINRIVVETLTPTGEAVGRIAVDPNDVNLNPNSSSLAYRLTIYRPEGDYRLRVRVFGNYE
jgi:hypothetical protein